MNDEYSKQLAEWKRKHGVSEAEDSAVRDAETRMLQEQRVSKEQGWCMHCDAHLPVSEMKIIFWRIDPYLQIDDIDGEDEADPDYIKPENRIYLCATCFEEEYGDALEGETNLIIKRPAKD